MTLILVISTLRHVLGGDGVVRHNHYYTKIALLHDTRDMHFTKSACRTGPGRGSANPAVARRSELKEAQDTPTIEELESELETLGARDDGATELQAWSGQLQAVLRQMEALHTGYQVPAAFREEESSDLTSD